MWDIERNVKYSFRYRATITVHSNTAIATISSKIFPRFPGVVSGPGVCVDSGVDETDTVVVSDTAIIGVPVGLSIVLVGAGDSVTVGSVV